MQKIIDSMKTPNFSEASQGMELIEATLLNNISGAAPSSIKCAHKCSGGGTE